MSSRQVAENFEKRHDHVIRDIEDILESVPKIGETPLFHKTTYIHEQNNQEYPEFLMTRDGFSLLAMGFTGSKALQWKLKYIQAFNQMEQQLKTPKLNTDLETRMRIAKLINGADKEARPYILQLFREYLSQLPKPKNSIVEFLEDIDFIGLSTHYVYESYLKYCRHNDLTPSSKIDFTRKVNKCFGTCAKQKRENGSRCKFFVKR